MNEDVWIFLQKNGVSLLSEGSAEKAFTQTNALELIALLLKLNIKILGFEIWRREFDRYKIDSLSGWYAPNSDDVVESITEAKNLITTYPNEKMNVYFTIQF